MDDVLKLPAKLDAASATALFETLLSRRGQAIEIDGSTPEKVSALSLEVLLSARNQWAEDGLSFRVREASAALSAACEGLGIGLATLNNPSATSERGIQ